MRILRDFTLLKFFILCTIFFTLAGCTAPAEPPTAGEEAADNSIIAALQERGQFTTLIDALQLQQTELLEKLDQAQSYTFFAPTDEAFEKLPPETLDQLLSDNTEILNEILEYHVLTEQFFTEELRNKLANSSSVDGHTPTLQLDTFFGEKPVTIALVGDFLKVNNAQIIEPDLEEINNVIIHGIDTVLTPIAPPRPDEPKLVDDIEVWFPYEPGEFLFIRDAELVPGADPIRTELESVGNVLFQQHQENTGFSNQINTARTVRLTDDKGTIYLAPVGPNEELDQETLQAIADESGVIIALMVVEARDESILSSGSYVVRVRSSGEWFVELVSQENEIIRELPAQFIVSQMEMGTIPDVALFYGTIWCEFWWRGFHWCTPCWGDEESACKI